jgi:ribose 5-phosphate isomerase A
MRRMTSPAGPDPAALDRVATAALRHVADGMLLGLGTGRAAEAFIERLGERVRRGLRVRGVATSERSEALARKVAIETIPLDQVAGRFDVAFDGADEVAPDLALTKGLGGALVRERVVAREADRFIVLVTPEKLVSKLGERTPVPVEVVPFAVSTVERSLGKLGGRPVLRTTQGGGPYRTDNGNCVLDTGFDPIDDPAALEAAIDHIPGVVDCGLFVGMASLVLVGDPHGVRELTRNG